MDRSLHPQKPLRAFDREEVGVEEAQSDGERKVALSALRMLELMMKVPLTCNRAYALEFASPSAPTRTKRPRGAAQRKASASVTPAASTAPKRRTGRWAKKDEDEGKEEKDEKEVKEEEDGAEDEERGSVAETASVAETDTGPGKALRTSSRRKSGHDENKNEPPSRGVSRGRSGRGGRARGRGRGRGH